jgi:ABC-type sugar transport system ATPase subunit
MNADNVHDAQHRAILLSMSGIRKSFPGVQALQDVALDVRSGEVHAVVGENGAGKTTLMQILAGVYQPDDGQIDFAGHTNIRFVDEQAAQRAGIALVFQERSLFGPLSIADNVFAGRQPTTAWHTIDRRALYQRTSELLHAVGLNAPVQAAVDSISPAQQQLVEVAKALSLQPKLLIFDEPTAALSPRETGVLFRLIDRLRRDGVGVLYISHRLEEVMSLSDRVTVLKDGVNQGVFITADITTDVLVSKMVGRALNPHVARSVPVDAPQNARIVLDVEGVSDVHSDRRPRLQNVRLQVRAGEILGLAGLVGAGRTELAMALFGFRRGIVGRVRVHGQDVRLGHVPSSLAAGIGYVPEDRKEFGLFLEMGIADNVLSVPGNRPSAWWLRSRCITEHAAAACHRLRVVCRGMDEPVGALSGGNQQKLLLARWKLAGPKVLIVDEPTRGVDVGSKAEIHQLLYEMAGAGTAILVISSDLPEVLTVSDRVVVMTSGRIAGELAKGEATEEAVLRLASPREGLS